MIGHSEAPTNKSNGLAPACRVAIESVRLEVSDLIRFVQEGEAGGSTAETLAGEPWGAFAFGRLVATNDVLKSRGFSHGERVVVSRAELGPMAGSFWRREIDVPADAVHSIAPRWTTSRAALLPEAALALRALRASAATAGDRFAVLGLGTSALCAVHALKMEGVQFVVAADADEVTLRAAKSLGADLTLQPDAFQALAESNPDHAADRTLCFMPDNVLLAHGIRCTSDLGLMVIVGFVGDDTALIPDYYRQIIIKETTLIGAQRPDAGDWTKAATILSTGRLDHLGDSVEIDVDATLTERLRCITPSSLMRRQVFLVFSQ